MDQSNTTNLGATEASGPLQAEQEGTPKRRRRRCRVCRRRWAVSVGLCTSLKCLAFAAAELGQWAVETMHGDMPPWIEIGQAYWGAIERIEGAERPRDLFCRPEQGRAA